MQGRFNGGFFCVTSLGGLYLEGLVHVGAYFRNFTVSAKKEESYATTISWVRAKVSFAILRSALLCLRGSRTPRRKNLDVKDRDLGIEKGQAGLP